MLIVSKVGLTNKESWRITEAVGSETIVYYRHNRKGNASGANVIHRGQLLRSRWACVTGSTCLRKSLKNMMMWVYRIIK